MPVSANWSSVAYGNGIFVAIASGPSNIAATSTDGTTWTQRTLPSSSNWSSVAYGNGIFVAIADDSLDIAATSKDGVTWTQIGSLPLYNWRYVTYGNGIFLAFSTGSSNIAATSKDGITWTQRTLPVNANWSSVAYGNGIFLAVSTGPSSIGAISTDGITWTQTVIITSYNWTSISYGNGIFVAVNSSASFVGTTHDGLNWTLMAVPTNAICITYGNGTFVSVRANSAIAINSVEKFANTYGLNQPSPVAGSANQIIYKNSSNVAAGSNNLIFDGTNTGIGTTSPRDKLEVNGGIIASSISGGAADNGIMNGRLTLVSGSPTTDGLSSTLYYTPYNGNRISLYDTANGVWKIHTFTEISISLAGLIGGNVYDIFIYDNNGTKILESTAWTTSTNRDLGPTYSWTTGGNNYLQDGVYVKTGSLNKRYIGTIYMFTTGSANNNIINRHVWNMYNRIDVSMNPTVSGIVNWTYASSTWRVLGGAAGPAGLPVDVVIGQSEDIIDITIGSLMGVPAANCYALLGLTVDGTMQMDGGTRSNTVGQNQLYANYKFKPTDYTSGLIGRHYFEVYEARAGTGTYNGFGGTGNGSYFGGIFAKWRC